jgi:hypothetical protein
MLLPALMLPLWRNFRWRLLPGQKMELSWNVVRKVRPNPPDRRSMESTLQLACLVRRRMELREDRFPGWKGPAVCEQRRALPSQTDGKNLVR